VLIVVAWWTVVFASRFAAIQIVAVAICPFAKTHSNCVGTRDALYQERAYSSVYVNPETYHPSLENKESQSAQHCLVV
jgi:hypothetical protein